MALPYTAAALCMRIRALLAVFLLYLVLTVAMTWPLALAPASLVPADYGDPLLNAWILWLNAQSVPLTARWWDAPAFYPSHDVLAFSENLVGLTWLTSPLQWAGADPLAAHNVAFMASWILGGVAAWTLAYVLTGRADAALAGSAVFAFAPYRASQVSHLQVLTSYWMPLALAALHVYVRTGAPRWLVAFAAAWLLQGLSNGYYLVFFGVLVVLWAAWFAARSGSWARLGGIAAASAAVGLASLPLLLKYHAVHERYGFRRDLGEIAGFSGDVLSVLDASSRLVVWSGLRVFHRPEGELFPGLTVLLVVVAGLVLGPVARGRPLWQRIGRGVLAAGFLLALGACVSYGVWGGWRHRWAGIDVSMREPTRPLAVAVALGLALAMTRPGLRAAIERRSALLFYVGAAVVLWSCALGPSPTIAGQATGWPSPYELLSVLPGFAGLRVPARFWMLVVLTLSAAAALAYARVPLRPQWRPVAVVVITGAIVAEGWIGALPLPNAPDRWPSFVARGSSVPVLQVTGPNLRFETVAMYRAAAVHRPVLNGYSGYFPPQHQILVQALAMRDLSVLNGPSAGGPLEILLDRRDDRGGYLTRRLARTRAVLQANDARWSLYSLPQVSATNGPSLASGRAIEIRPVAAWASINDDLAGAVADGRLETRWYTDVQRPGHMLTLDLGRPVRVGAVRLAQGDRALEYPRVLTVERSLDGLAWFRMWEGPTSAFAWRAALEAPLRMPLTLPLDGCETRYLRLGLAVESPGQPWSVAEASVIEPAPGGCAGS